MHCALLTFSQSASDFRHICAIWMFCVNRCQYWTLFNNSFEANIELLHAITRFNFLVQMLGMYLPVLPSHHIIISLGREPSFNFEMLYASNEFFYQVFFRCEKGKSPSKSLCPPVLCLVSLNLSASYMITVTIIPVTWNPIFNKVF